MLRSSCQPASPLAPHRPRWTFLLQEEDEEEGGMEEPPEIRDFIRELGGSLEQEAASAGAGGGLPVPR